MFRFTENIESTVSALDEIADVRMTLCGLSDFALATATGEAGDSPDAARLAHCLLAYCAATLSAATRAIEESIGNAS